MRQQWQGFTIGDDNQGGIRLLAPPVARLPAISAAKGKGLATSGAAS